MSARLTVIDNELAHRFCKAFNEFDDALKQFGSETLAQSLPMPELEADSVERMRTRLTEIVAQIDRRSMSRHNYGTFSEQIGEVRYAFVALVDEILINRDWPGKQQWQDQLLEELMFKTRVSGEKIFERIDAVLRVRSQISLAMAEVYLQCLNLGFMGKFRSHPNPQEKIGPLRRYLFYFLYEKRPDLGNPDRVLAEDVDTNVIPTEPHLRDIAKPIRWYWFALGIFAIPFFISCALWMHIYVVLHPVLIAN